MKTHIQTSKLNYLLNIIVSGAIAFYVGLWLPINSIQSSLEMNDIIFPFLLFIFIFHHFFRAGEYILTGKTITISPRLIDGYEEKGKTAKWSFIYYLTTATLLTLWILYLTSNLSKFF